MGPDDIQLEKFKWSRYKLEIEEWTQVFCYIFMKVKLIDNAVLIKKGSSWVISWSFRRGSYKTIWDETNIFMNQFGFTSERSIMDAYYL